jgi:hypothetical protein
MFGVNSVAPPRRTRSASKPKNDRSTTITLASIVAFVAGITSLIGCIIIAVVFYLSYPNYVDFLPYFGLIVNNLGINVRFVGIAVFIIAILHILAGYYFWESSTKGGYLGTILSAIDLLSFGLAYAFPSMLLILNGAVITGSVLLSLIVLGWDSINH